MQGGGDRVRFLEIPPPSAARKSPPGSLAETPRGGGEDRPLSPPLLPPFPSSLRGALCPTACRARPPAAPATALRSFFFFLPAKPVTSSPRPGRRRLPLRCRRRRDTAHTRGLTPAAAEGYTTRKRTQHAPPPLRPATCASPRLLPALALHPGRRRGRPPAREAPRLARGGGTALTAVPISARRGAAPRRRDLAEGKQGPGYPADRAARPCVGRRSPGRLTRRRDASARSCPLNAGTPRRGGEGPVVVFIPVPWRLGGGVGCPFCPGVCEATVQSAPPRLRERGPQLQRLRELPGSGTCFPRRCLTGI